MRSNKIAEYRKKAGLNQKELGEYLGVAPTTISGWERGYREPDNESMAKMQKLFNVPIDKVLLWYMDDNQQAELEYYHDKYSQTSTYDYPEVINIANAADCMDKDQRARLLIIAKAAFPGAFTLAEQKTKEA